jgi:hypothetical protein
VVAVAQPSERVRRKRKRSGNEEKEESELFVPVVVEGDEYGGDG